MLQSKYYTDYLGLDQQWGVKNQNLQKHVIIFLNANGGYVAVGINKDGIIKGVLLSEEDVPCINADGMSLFEAFDPPCIELIKVKCIELNVEPHTYINSNNTLKKPYLVLYTMTTTYPKRIYFLSNEFEYGYSINSLPNPFTRDFYEERQIKKFMSNNSILGFFMANSALIYELIEKDKKELEKKNECL